MTVVDGASTSTAPRQRSTSSSGRRAGFAVLVLGLLSLLILPFFADVIAHAGPRARDGVIGFAQWGPLKAPVPLAGDWQLSWRGGPGGPPSGERVTVAVPGRWSNARAGRPPLPETGAVSYHLRVEGLPAGRYILHVPTSFSATAVAVNGRVISQRGEAGPTKRTTRYVAASQDVFLQTDGRPLDLRLDVSTFHHRDNGLDNPPLLGLTQPMGRWITLDWIRSLLLVTSLLLLACYGGVVFLFRTNDRASLYFALAAVFLVPTIAVFRHDNLLLIAYPGMSFLQMLTVQYLSGSVALAFVVAHTHQLFPKESPRFVQSGLEAYFVALILIFGGLALTGDTFAMSTASHWTAPLRTCALLYVVAVVAFAAFRKRDGAVVYTLGMLVFAATAIYSSLVTNGVVVRSSSGLDPLPLGMLLLLFSQIVILAERWSLAMGEAEQRSDDLEQLLDVNSSITAEIRLEALLQRIVEATSRFIHAERASLFLFDSKADELWSIAAEGVGAHQIRFPSDGGLAGACFMAGEAINIPDAYADDRFNRSVDVATGYRTTSVLTIPVKARDGRKLGVMQALNSTDGKPFSDADVGRMTALSAQAAIAIDNANLFAEVASERNYNESILRSMSSGVVTLDVDASVVKLNAAACEILEVEPEDAAKPETQRAWAQNNPWLSAELAAVGESGQAKVLLDAEMKTVLGNTVSANISIVPLIVEDQQAGLLIIIEDISEGKRLQGAMRRFMTQKVVDQIMGREDELLFGAACEASVLFADIRGFTSLAEHLGPRDTVDMLNEIFTDLFEAVAASDGVLDKYIGDAIMAVYGAPLSSGRDPQNAVDSAVSMVAMIVAINGRRRARGLADVRLGVGVASGAVVAGTIGSPKRMDYTVIGDSVNLASRLEAITKAYGVGIVICEDTAKASEGLHPMRELDAIKVRGRQRPARIFQVLTADAEVSTATLEAYARGREAMAGGRWEEAIAAFEAALAASPGDGPSALMLQRSRTLATSPPPADWDGVWDSAKAA